MKNVYLSLLAACTYETYEDCWSSSFTSQGLTNRFFLVPGMVEKQVSLPQLDDDKKASIQKQVREVITNIGLDYEMKIDKDAYELYNAWYIKTKKDIKNIDKHKRIEWICLKLACMIALCDGKYTITKDSMRKSIKICEWQMEVRMVLKPIEAETLDSEIEGKIMKCLVGSKIPLGDGEINQKTKVKSRKGTTHFERVKNQLVRNGTIVLVKKENAKSGNIKPKMWINEQAIPQGWEQIQ